MVDFPQFKEQLIHYIEKKNTPYQDKLILTEWEITTLITKNSGHSPFPNVFDLTPLHLNTQAMLDFADTFQSSVLSADWGLAPQIYTCSSIVMKLLKIGGIDQRLPNYGRLGDLYHQSLLLLRAPFVIAALSPLYYSFIILGSTHTDYTDCLAVTTLSITVTLLILIEKYAVPAGFFPWLKSYTYRKRDLVELSSMDTFVQILSLIAFGLSGLLFRARFTHELTHNHFVLPYLIDISVWLFMSFGSFFVTGMLSSKILYFLNGLTFIYQPRGIEKLLRYVEKTHLLDETLCHYTFQKEFSLFAMVIVGLLGTYAFERLESESSLAFFLGASLSIISGYGVTKWILHRIHQREHLTLSEYHHEEDELVQNLIESHAPQPEQFAITCFSTSACIVGAIALLQRFYSSDPVLTSVVSLASSLFGYLFGLTLHQVLQESWSYGHQRFFKKSQHEVLKSKKHGESIRYEYLATKPN